MAYLLSLNKAWKCNHAIKGEIRYTVDFKSWVLLIADLLGELKALYPAEYAENYYWCKFIMDC